MTVKAKAIVAAFYGRARSTPTGTDAPRAARQGLKEAQMYPNDYDGIIAGAPANYWTHLNASSLWVAPRRTRRRELHSARQVYGDA